MRKRTKITTGVLGIVAAAGIGIGACGTATAPTQHNAPPPATQTQPPPQAQPSAPKPAPAPKQAPVTVSGYGEQVKSVDLQPGTYTVSYTADSQPNEYINAAFMIADVVNGDGTTDSVVNGMANDTSHLSGTTVYTVTDGGSHMVHVSNVDSEQWALTFTQAA